MKKQLVIIGIIVLLIAVGLSGCTNNSSNTEKKPVEKNLGDSITYGNLRYTFISANWESSTYYPNDPYYMYSLVIKCENVGSEADTGWIKIVQYEMKNGYKYSGSSNMHFFYINPGRNETTEISEFSTSNVGTIDIGFLPIVKIYLKIEKDDMDENAINVILNVS